MSAVRRIAVPAAVALALGLASAPAAQAAVAKGDPGVRKSGSCSASSNWELKAKHDNRRIEVEFEVDSNRVGQTWMVRITDNGARIFAGSRRTVGPSGSFTVRLLTADRAGADQIAATARNAATGETCRGVLRV